MTLQELYAKKGELQTTIEVADAQMKQVNQEIVKLLNANSQNGVKPAASVEQK